jgi:hypothetical protein
MRKKDAVMDTTKQGKSRGEPTTPQYTRHRYIAIVQLSDVAS